MRKVVWDMIRLLGGIFSSIVHAIKEGKETI